MSTDTFSVPTQNPIQNIVGEMRSRQRQKFRRFAGSSYDRQGKRWKDSPAVRQLLKMVDKPEAVQQSTEVPFSPAEGPIQKYLIGCNVRYQAFVVGYNGQGAEYSGTITKVTINYNHNTGQDEVFYLVKNSNGNYIVPQSSVIGPLTS